MKRQIVTAISLSLCLPLTWAATHKTATHATPIPSSAVTITPLSNLTTDLDKMSYTLGYDVGHNFKSQGLEVNPAVVYQGLVDGLKDQKPLLTQDQMQQTVIEFQKKMTAKREAEFKALSDKNLSAGKSFLETNKSKPGIKVLSDGLQYKVEREGSGASPKEGDLVTVNYVGSFVDGKEFDSSYKRGKPAVFKLTTDLIPGWVEAMKMMKPGAKWMLYVPPSLGYGDRGIGPIGPNQTLIFQIELLSVKPDKG